MLGFDPEEPYWPPPGKYKGQQTDAATNTKTIHPFPRQTVAIAWLRRREKSVLRAGILRDDMGLGKTVIALLLILISVNLDVAEAQAVAQPGLTPDPYLRISKYGNAEPSFSKRLKNLYKRKFSILQISRSITLTSPTVSKRLQWQNTQNDIEFVRWKHAKNHPCTQIHTDGSSSLTQVVSKVKESPQLREERTIKRNVSSRWISI